MKYMPLLLVLGMVGGCAFVAYEFLDGIERDEDQDATGVVRRRAAAVNPVPSRMPTLSSPPRSAESHPRLDVRLHGTTLGNPEWLDARICSIEAHLDRLERDCLRAEALARDRLPAPPLVSIGPTDRRTHGITSGRVFGKQNVVYRPARPATLDDDAGTAASLPSSALRSYFVDLFPRPL
jgi:hypothetical protein